ncbi:hypothetical protein TWF481_005059 [Arthrobotrys musiformis]|uniref:CFEM domain-containing protein n=1 Tax=Arthrobotrys musiformis TaxID=47236 RepID=A0AAV9WDV0_9PEZI
MYTSSVILGFLLAAPSLVAAQRETDKAVQLPPCVTTCYGLAIARASCDTLNPSCICGSNTFFSAIRTCLTTRDGTCTEEEAIDVWNKLQQQCAGKVSTAFPSLTFAVSRETSSATDTATATATEEPESTITPTMGIITDDPVETSDLPTEAPTTMGSITGPAEPTSSNTQGSQTSEGPTAPTETPNSATHMIPSVISMVLGSFVAGSALFFML